MPTNEQQRAIDAIGQAIVKATRPFIQAVWPPDREPHDDDEAREWLFTHPDPLLCACNGGGEYVGSCGFALHDCPHHSVVDVVMYDLCVEAAALHEARLTAIGLPTPSAVRRTLDASPLAIVFVPAFRCECDDATRASAGDWCNACGGVL